MLFQTKRFISQRRIWRDEIISSLAACGGARGQTSSHITEQHCGNFHSGCMLQVFYHSTTRPVLLWQMSHHKLLTIETQVAFVVTDSTQDTDTTHWAALAEEVLYCTALYCVILYCTLLYCTVQGQNLAFITRTRLPVSGGECDWGLRCVASSLGSLLVAAHEAALTQEMELFEQVSE